MPRQEECCGVVCWLFEVTASVNSKLVYVGCIVCWEHERGLHKSEGWLEGCQAEGSAINCGLLVRNTFERLSVRSEVLTSLAGLG